MAKKFKINDRLIIYLKNKEQYAGKLTCLPTRSHPYWYIVIAGDTSLISIHEDNVNALFKPSDNYLADLNKKLISKKIKK